MTGPVSVAAGPRFAQDAYCKPDAAQSPPGSAESSPQAGVAVSSASAAPAAHPPMDLRQLPLDPAVAVKVSTGLTQTHATLPPVENLYTPAQGFFQSRLGMAVEGATPRPTAWGRKWSMAGWAGCLTGWKPWQTNNVQLIKRNAFTPGKWKRLRDRLRGRRLKITCGR